MITTTLKSADGRATKMVQITSIVVVFRLLPVSGSVVTAAVRPTPEEPRPVVGMARGAELRTYLEMKELSFCSLRTILFQYLCVPGDLK